MNFLFATIVFVCAFASSSQAEDGHHAVAPFVGLNNPDMAMDAALLMDQAQQQVGRYSRSLNEKKCGKHLFKYVHAVCGQSCEVTNGFQIATYCCANSCPIELIRENCCPSQ